MNWARYNLAPGPAPEQREHLAPDCLTPRPLGDLLALVFVPLGQIIGSGAILLR
jgi:hypothetical protein